MVECFYTDFYSFGDFEIPYYQFARLKVNKNKGWVVK